VLPASIDDYYADLAAKLADEDLQRQLEAARRCVQYSVRTRKELARHRVFCLECELKKRAQARDERNPGRA